MTSNPTNQGQRVAVVTGGAGAIGGAIVARLAPDHTTAVLDRAGDVVVDLGDPDDVRRAAKLVLDRYGRCDVFVHAAATFEFGPLEQVDPTPGATFRRSTSNRLCSSVVAMLARDEAEALTGQTLTPDGGKVMR